MARWDRKSAVGGCGAEPAERTGSVDEWVGGVVGAVQHVLELQEGGVVGQEGQVLPHDVRRVKVVEPGAGVKVHGDGLQHDRTLHTPTCLVSGREDRRAL